MWQAVEATIETRRADLPPLAQQYYRDRDNLLKLYDTLPERVLGARPELLRLYDTYREIQRSEAAGRHKASLFRKANKELDNALKAVDRLKEQLRKLRPDIDAALVKWRGATPIAAQR